MAPATSEVLTLPAAIYALAQRFFFFSAAVSPAVPAFATHEGFTSADVYRRNGELRVIPEECLKQAYVGSVRVRQSAARVPWQVADP